MRTTETHGNSRNGIRGSRISIYTDAGELVDRFVVPARHALAYCQRYAGGEYGQRYAAAIATAQRTEDAEYRQRVGARIWESRRMGFNL